MSNAAKQQICRSFADLLDYPGEPLPARVAEFLGQLEEDAPRQLKAVRRFAEYLSDKSPGTLEELYSQTFDLTPANSLYLGYHLFGETPKRSAFLVKLHEAYEGQGFSAGSELADHLCVMLRFLSTAQDRDFYVPLLQECILPALAKSEKELLKEDNPYGWLVQALKDFLQGWEGPREKAGGGQNA